jgi:hypothetical protein
MKEFVIAGEKSYWGDQCSDKFRKRSRTDRQPVIEDLLSWRDRWLVSEHQPPREGRKTVGIPRAMFYYDRFPFWCAYLQSLGYNVAVSDLTDRGIVTKGEELAIAQPCLPIQVAHGHVQELLESGVDYILLPNAVDAETPFMQAESKLCRSKNWSLVWTANSCAQPCTFVKGGSLFAGSCANSRTNSERAEEPAILLWTRHI